MADGVIVKLSTFGNTVPLLSYIYSIILKQVYKKNFLLDLVVIGVLIIVGCHTKLSVVKYQ